MKAGQVALESSGQPEEKSCPYSTDLPAAGWKPQAGALTFRRRSHSITPRFADVKAALLEQRLVVLGVRLPESFFQPVSPWVIEPEGRTHGLHAIVAAGVGKHRATEVILIRNSWGRHWADNGYALLTARFLDRHLLDAVVLDEEVTS